MSPLSRREFLGATAASAATLAFPQVLRSDDGLDAIQAEIVKRHGEGVARLQEWVRQPSIAAEGRGMAEGCDLLMRFAREAGFQQVTRIPTDGQPGVFATLDAGAARMVGLYFNYDVKQVDPADVVVAAMGGGARRKARLRQGSDGPRRGEPEGSGGRVPRRPPCHPGRRLEASCRKGSPRGALHAPLRPGDLSAVGVEAAVLWQP